VRGVILVYVGSAWVKAGGGLLFIGGFAYFGADYAQYSAAKARWDADIRAYNRDVDQWNKDMVVWREAYGRWLNLVNKWRGSRELPPLPDERVESNDSLPGGPAPYTSDETPTQTTQVGNGARNLAPVLPCTWTTLT